MNARNTNLLHAAQRGAVGLERQTMSFFLSEESSEAEAEGTLLKIARVRVPGRRNEELRDADLEYANDDDDD